jgi:hypothetical protein
MAFELSRTEAFFRYFRASAAAAVVVRGPLDPEIRARGVPPGRGRHDVHLRQSTSETQAAIDGPASGDHENKRIAPAPSHLMDPSIAIRARVRFDKLLSHQAVDLLLVETEKYFTISRCF